MKKRIAFLALSLILAFGFSGCGTKSEKTVTAEELVQQKDAITSAHEDLWNTVFDSIDESFGKDIDDSTEFLIKAIDAAKDSLSEEDIKTLKEDVDKLKEIDKQLASLPQTDTNTYGSTLASAKTFPAFQGKDFDGNAVDESLFANNTVTLVNFWYNSCRPCVEEMPVLKDLHNYLKEKGGAVVGVNVDTLDGKADVITAAKEILEKQGVSYQNIYFDTDSEAGKLASSIMAFPTTLLIDKDGNIVGDPVVGGLRSQKDINAVKERADAIIAEK